MDSTTQAYCEIAESNKRRREDTKLKGETVMEAFRSRMCAAVRARKEGETVMEAFRSRMCAAVRARKKPEAAAQAIDEARAAVGRVALDSDDDNPPPNEFDDILNEVCAEAGYESEESDEEAW